jgi:aminoglycoside phosphotransferase (APT) family kinase protein
VYATGGTQHTLDVFVKVAGVRKMPLLVKGIMAAFAPEPREYALLTRVDAGALVLPMAVPRLIAAHASRWLGRTLLVQELVPTSAFKTVADWVAPSLEQLQAMLTLSAPLHARFWRQPNHPELSFAYDKRGLDAIAGVVEYALGKAGDAPPYIPKLWHAIKAVFDADPRQTLVHGDCRPGNMLFRQPNVSDAAAGAMGSAAVVFTDWEACGVMPFLWDFTYCTMMGQRVDDRRRNHDALLRSYIAALVAAGVPADDVPLARCQLSHNLLCYVIAYYGFALGIVSAVGDVQGNTTSDVTAWVERIVAARRDAFADGSEEMAAATGAPVQWFRDILDT